MISGLGDNQAFFSVNAVAEIVQHAGDDDPLWFSLTHEVSVRPLLFDCTNGGWTNLLRVKPGGRLARHYHIGTVHAFVVRGSWRYLEHDWIAKEGTFIFEPPGEIHTLVADPSNGTTTFFVNRGALIYTDDNGHQTGFDDVFTRLLMFRSHLKSRGLDPTIADGLVR